MSTCCREIERRFSIAATGSLNEAINSRITNAIKRVEHYGRQGRVDAYVAQSRPRATARERWRQQLV
jgi:hypothetical protein